MAYPRRRPSLASRLWALALSAGLAFVALHCLVAGLRGPDYGFSLFGLFFVALSGIALNLAVRGEQ